MMQRLRQLRVDGFRSLRKVDLELGDLSVLIGANGSGKSNLVAFLDMLSFATAGKLQLYVGLRGNASSILHYGPKRTSLLPAELRFEDGEHWSEYHFRLAFAAQDRLIYTLEDLGFEREGASKPIDRLLDSARDETELLWLADRGTSPMNETAREILAYFSGLQIYHFHDTTETAQNRLSQDIDRNRSLLRDGGNLAAFLYRLRHSHPKHYHRIHATVRLVVPFLEDFVLEPDGLNARRIQLHWRDRNPDYEFGAHQLSDGSLRALALVTTLLQPQELLPSLLVIDEPELGLHPGAVGLIGQLIKAVSSKCQVIVATQSPRLVSELSPEDVVVVEREEDASGCDWSTFRRLAKQDLGKWLDDYDLGELYEMNVTGGGPS